MPIDLAFEAWFNKFGDQSFIIEAKWEAGFKAIMDAFNDYYKTRGKNKTVTQLRQMVSSHGSRYRGELVQQHKNSTRKLGDANEHVFIVCLPLCLLSNMKPSFTEVNRKYILKYYTFIDASGVTYYSGQSTVGELGEVRHDDLIQWCLLL